MQTSDPTHHSKLRIRGAIHEHEQDNDLELCHSVTCLLRTEFDYVSLKTTWHQLQTSNPKRPLPEIHAKWRPVIFEWFYKIVDHFLLDRGIVAIAMDYVDRFLLLHPSRSAESMTQKVYQLIAMSALYTAMKLHGGNDNGTMGAEWKLKRKTFCIKGFVKLSRGQFEPKDILDMEIHILKILSWKMNPVTFSCFLDRYMLLFPSSEHLFPSDQSRRTLKRNCVAIHVLHNLARYFVELGVCIPGITPYFQTEYSTPYINPLAPSSVSYAALLLAMDMMTLSAIPQSARQIFLARFSIAQNQIIVEQPDTRYMLMTPDSSEIQTIKDLIHFQFEPSLLLGPLPGPDEGGIDHNPFQIAQKAGMFNMEFFKDDKNGITKSPTSPLEDGMLL
jgi:lipoyl(octanoyl) transferase